MDASSEEDLLKGARGFDRTSLAVIYDRYSPGIYRYAVRLSGDECLGEECVAETFTRLLKALRAGQGPRDHLQAYLYRTAHNWLTDRFRRDPLPALELNETLWAGESSAPEALFQERQETSRVRAALQALTPDQQKVITLRFVEGWENEEVAAALQKPQGAVRALQHRALQTLRRLLSGTEKEG